MLITLDPIGKRISTQIISDAHTANNVSPACFQYNGLKGFGAEADVTNRFLNQTGSWFGLKSFVKKVCPINPTNRSHFVIHCTAGKMSEASIKAKTKFNVPGKKKRSAAHIYVHLDGSKFEVWPLTEKNVWATKIESKKS